MDVMGLCDRVVRACSKSVFTVFYSWLYLLYFHIIYFYNFNFHNGYYYYCKNTNIYHIIS